MSDVDRGLGAGFGAAIGWVLGLLTITVVVPGLAVLMILVCCGVLMIGSSHHDDQAQSASPPVETSERRELVAEPPPTPEDLERQAQLEKERLAAVEKSRQEAAARHAAEARDLAERRGRAKLKLCQQQIDAGELDAARFRLAELIKQYPNTQAAAQARKLLEKLRP